MLPRLSSFATELLRTTRPVDLSYADVAAGAGVSVRTVYRHFPTPEDLFMAVSELVFADILPTGEPRSLGHLIDILKRNFAMLEQDPALFRIMFAVPSRSRLDQSSLFARFFGAQLQQLSAEDHRSAFALIDLFSSPYAWDVMHHNWGLPLERSLRAVLVASQALFEYLERHPDALSPDTPEPSIAELAQKEGSE